MTRGDLLAVEVAYALPEEQLIIKVDVPGGTTLREAIERSGLLKRYPSIDLAAQRVGRWSQLAGLDEPVRAGDRIEIYRPLVADPKEARRQRAAQTRRR